VEDIFTITPPMPIGGAQHIQSRTSPATLQPNPAAHKSDTEPLKALPIRYLSTPSVIVGAAIRLARLGRFIVRGPAVSNLPAALKRPVQSSDPPSIGSIGPANNAKVALTELGQCLQSTIDRCQQRTFLSNFQEVAATTRAQSGSGRANVP